mmetsp:Transcript_47853/g.113709  ORF Transcript_47853/g.113709 Transcript_47853/m.113709 type:complete len:308 (-) Transcript_47853:83-1006(-)|eukprot:CAMPEP_0178431608 /NCGR_PEP_ID=MMETSP0689_2-20121128/31943_1 /TAXON_ID=160604 /ORGANISM="Amphidinium massartii, Strain CS-259" /LENGTH=307 /DNA_ID=CAMNT_0020053541 /DNA_START=22 /DNA_END=945 /DNA_ORIENTATION=+
MAGLPGGALPKGNASGEAGSSLPAGYFVAAAGFFLHFFVQLVLLLAFCVDKGCFTEGCQGPPPTVWNSAPQCLPPQSDTYIIYEPTIFQYSRRVVMLVVVFTRGFMDTWLGVTTHNLLLTTRQTQGCCLVFRVIRSLIFSAAILANSVLDILSVVFWNKGIWMGLHHVLSTWLIIEWVFLIGPPYNIALCGEGSRRTFTGSTIIWVVVVMCFALGFSLHYGYNTNSWVWYLGEWILISTQGIAITIAGVSLPLSYRIRRQRTCGLSSLCRPLEWQLPCGIEVFDDDRAQYAADSEEKQACLAEEAVE